MASGDVLAIPFPPITASLFRARPPAPPLSRLQPAQLARYAGWSWRTQAGTALQAELFGPAPVRWRRDLRAWARLRPRPGQPPAARFFRLALQGLAELPPPPAGELWTPTFLEHLWRVAGVLPYRHQLDTARRALFELGGRAVLADEVGLGKTIEAGIVLHELWLRRLARRALILVPAGLAWQWYRELRDKFDLPVELQGSELDWERVPLLIGSLDTAKRPPHRERVLAAPYDLLIVDEAHRLKNHQTRAYQLVAAIRARHLLLVTATPVHNTLRELHSLCYLVAPEEVGEFPDFCRRFGTRGRFAEDPAGLRRLVQGLVVRHRRSGSEIPFTRRLVHTVPVDLSPEERALYRALERHFAGAVRGAARPERSALPLTALTLKREACSSPYAAAVTLERLARQLDDPQLASLAQQARAAGQWAKADAVVQLVERLGDEHVLVFTEYTATQQAIAHRLSEALGRPVVLFYGALTPMQREWAQAAFREQAPIMVSTDAGAEGVNLQFCCHLVNLDLPWNPMRIEQRIGRLHRLGQTRDVHVWNVYTRGTVEEYVLYLLHEKLDLFRSVVGELDQILEPMGGSPGFEAALADVLRRGPAEGLLPDLERSLEELIQQWNAAFRRYRSRQALQAAVFGEDGA